VLRHLLVGQDSLAVRVVTEAVRRLEPAAGELASGVITELLPQLGEMTRKEPVHVLEVGLLIEGAEVAILGHMHGHGQ
jgi:hypothetical protein